MAIVFNDRVKQITNTIGTDPYSLGDSVAGFETFGDSFSDGDETSYCCTDGNDYEIGHGVISNSGTVISRSLIVRSSNSDSSVVWPSGNKTITCTLSSAFVPSYSETEPNASSNPIFVGAEHINRATGSVWICTDNTTDANVWKRSGAEDNTSDTIALVIALG